MTVLERTGIELESLYSEAVILDIHNGILVVSLKFYACKGSESENHLIVEQNISCKLNGSAFSAVAIWNPWHGCRKISAGCANCYVYRRDGSIGKDASVVSKTGDYDLPLKKNRQGQYKLTADDGIVFACMTSDFFLEEADDWRQGCWDMIRQRQDLHFHIITKRIDRFAECIPPDWGGGWDNVTICCTCENQDRTDYRLPVFLSLPIKHREVICEPMIGGINMEKYLAAGGIEHVSCGGESGDNARPCDFRWIQEVRRECIRCGIHYSIPQELEIII